MIGVYSIIDNYGRIYIGSSIDIKERFRQHRKDLIENRHKNKYMQNVFNKHGLEFFRFDVIEECSKESVTNIEQLYLDFVFSSISRGFIYNINKISNRPSQEYSTRLKKSKLLSKPVNLYNINTKEKVTIQYRAEFSKRSGISTASIRLLELGTRNCIKGWILYSNLQKYHKQIYTFKNIISGEIIKCDNLASMARDKSLCSSSLLKIWKGKRKVHKGWIKHVTT